MNIRLNTKVISTIPVFIAVNIAAVGIWFFDISSQSMPLILGIIAGGLVDLDNRLTGRLKNVFFTLYCAVTYWQAYPIYCVNDGADIYFHYDWCRGAAL